MHRETFTSARGTGDAFGWPEDSPDAIARLQPIGKNRPGREEYADDDAFAAHSASEVHAAASPVFTELIAAADVTIGETLMAKGPGG